MLPPLLGRVVLNNPFTNLTLQQRILQTMRLLFPFVAFILVIVLYTRSSNTLDCFLVQLNCDHVDLSKGLSQLLNEGLDYAALMSPHIDIPFYIDPSTPESMLAVFKDFAREKIEDAPQYFIFGFNDYCWFRYDTDYSLNHDSAINVTWMCQEYDGLNFLDFKRVLIEKGFQVIYLTIEISNDNNADVNDRLQQLLIFKTVTFIQGWLLPSLFLTTLGVYGQRAECPDLRTVSKWLLHVPLALAMVSGISMTCSFATVFRILEIERKQIKDQLGKFGISMNYGDMFFFFYITSFVLATLTMLVWIIPMWCSNPPDHDDSIEVVMKTVSSPPKSVATSSGHTLGRMIRGVKSGVSRLESVSRQNLKLPLIKISEKEISSDVFAALEKVESEAELRRLGNQLSHRPHVRASTQVRKNETGDL
ncbi:hypothetical protein METBISCDRAFT_26625 [Metschnikowia bicuspidata]|uniref:Uncharacterized protein n=1 Tax=Metschnikowia bicuspidata TaxID=27322 RepID=A0A4P9ZEM2_9ASCO|nr:hypothetical protein METBISCDRAFT_26625 [Metschnikowia bicuspidata]